MRIYLYVGLIPFIVEWLVFITYNSISWEWDTTIILIDDARTSSKNNYYMFLELTGILCILFCFIVNCIGMIRLTYYSFYNFKKDYKTILVIYGMILMNFISIKLITNNL